jgi:hypothetical protein
MRRTSHSLTKTTGALLLLFMLLGSSMAHMPLELDTYLDVTTGPAEPPQKGLLQKAGPELTKRLHQGVSEDLGVLVTALPHDGITRQTHPDRAAAMTAMEQAAAPFFQQVEFLTEHFGGTVMATHASAPAVSLQGDLTLLQAVAMLPEVHHVALDYVGTLTLSSSPEIGPRIPADARVAVSDGRQMIEAEEAWALGYRGDGVSISVIDTGIDPDHEAFKFANGTSRIVAWANCIGPGCDESGQPFDDESHGTHVAGIAAGSGWYDDPTHGINEEIGVATNATIMAAKFLNAQGSGSFQDGIDALEWSFAQGADIAQNSWGGACSAATGVIQTVNQLSLLGMANVFAAGNSGPNSGTIGGPACAVEAIAVGAVDRDYLVAGFSSRGPCTDPTEDDGQRICPDLVALGVAVRAPVPREGCFFCDPSGYNTWGGTSAAAPHVAGAMAIAEQAKRELDGEGFGSPAQALELFKLTALPLPSEAESPNTDYGWGHPKLMNILAMLDPTDEAEIIDTFSISNDELGLGDSTMLSFSVRNVGGAVATGDFTADLEAPDGSVLSLADEEVSLGLLESMGITHTVTAVGELAPGNYTFRGSFEYSWTNGTGETKTGVVSHEGTFTVNRIFLAMDLEGFEESALPGVPQALEFTLASVGNAAARGATVEFTVADRYLFVPGSNFSPLDMNTLYADPAPDRIIEQPNQNRLVLVWDVGDLPPGDSFSFTTTVAGTVPDTYRFLGTVKFEDDAQRLWSQSKAFWQDVGLGL